MSVVVEETIEVDVPTISEEEGRRREILLRAVEVLDERGWAQGGLGMYPQAGVGFCILGAVAHAANAPLRDSGFSFGPQYDYLVPNAILGTTHDLADAFTWNDTDARDKEHVQTVLRRLANGSTWEQAIDG